MEYSLRVRELHTLPAHPDESTVYKLLPCDRGSAYYAERTDRNIGWITPSEQETLQRSVVGIAGCGGMGGLVAGTLARLGIGELRIADCETFDVSNLNRQFAATRTTIGTSKAFATARMVRDITDDMTLVLYPQGITADTADHFLDGCDIICDEIEFWAVGARLLLHRQAKLAGVPLLNCSTVGFGMRLFLFDHAGMSMEDMVGFSCTEGYRLQQLLSAGKATQQEIEYVLYAMLSALIPELPEYRDSKGLSLSRNQCLARMREEGKAPIIATNPPLASGFLANQVLLACIDRMGHLSPVVRSPPTPGYLYFDAALMEARKVLRKEVHNDYGS